MQPSTRCPRCSGAVIWTCPTSHSTTSPTTSHNPGCYSSRLPAQLSNTCRASSSWRPSTRSLLSTHETPTPVLSCLSAPRCSLCACAVRVLSPRPCLCHRLPAQGLGYGESLDPWMAATLQPPLTGSPHLLGSPPAVPSNCSSPASSPASTKSAGTGYFTPRTSRTRRQALAALCCCRCTHPCLSRHADLSTRAPCLSA